MRPRIIYMGTPDFAVPALELLASYDAAEVALVVTQPDRRAGRGKKLVSPPVKMAADRIELPVLQTGTLRDPEVRKQITEINPDLIVVAAFGMILGKWILELPARGCVNLHASLLPKYRGANPISCAIAEGKQITGVTLMQMDKGLDTGGIYATREVDIMPDATTGSLTPELADVAGTLLLAHVGDLLDGTVLPQPQPAGATLTRQMAKSDGWLDFSRPAVELERHVRAMWPWPRAWTTGPEGERIQVHAADVAQETLTSPGEILHQEKDVVVGTGAGSLVLKCVQLPGGKPIEGVSIQQARVFTAGSGLGQVDRPEDLIPLVVPVDDTQ